MHYSQSILKEKHEKEEKQEKESFIQSLIQYQNLVSVCFYNDAQLNSIIMAVGSDFIFLKHHFLQLLYIHRIRTIIPIKPSIYFLINK